MENKTQKPTRQIIGINPEGTLSFFPNSIFKDEYAEHNMINSLVLGGNLFILWSNDMAMAIINPEDVIPFVTAHTLSLTCIHLDNETPDWIGVVVGEDDFGFDINNLSKLRNPDSSENHKVATIRAGIHLLTI